MVEVNVIISMPGTNKLITINKLLHKNKSTIYLNFSDIKNELINKKVIRETKNFKGDPLVFNELYKRAESGVSKGFSVIIDAENISPSIRKDIFTRLSKFNPNFIAFIITSHINKAAKNIINKYKKKYTLHQLENPYEMLKNYRNRIVEGAPTLEEGFNEINVVYNKKITSCVKRVLIVSSDTEEIKKYANMLSNLNVPYCTLNNLDLNVNIKPSENFKKHCMIKAKAYSKASNLPVLLCERQYFVKAIKSNKKSPRAPKNSDVINQEGTEISFTTANINLENLIKGCYDNHIVIIKNNTIKYKSIKWCINYSFIKMPEMIESQSAISSNYNNELSNFVNDAPPTEDLKNSDYALQKEHKFIKKQFKNYKNIIKIK